MVKKSRGGQTINSSQRRRQDYLRRKKIGAVLIEFAFSIPVFLILIYYIHDLPKFKLMQRKNQFAANILASTIQNISQQRENAGQNLTQKDIISVIRLSMLSVFPGMTQRSVGGPWGYSQCPLGYVPMVSLFVFSGTGENTATLKYNYRFYPWYWLSNVYGEGHHSSNNDFSIVEFSETKAALIYPDFRISSGETKCIIDFRFFTDSSSNFPNGIKANTMTRRELFGFLFYNPVSPNSCSYFHAITIFKPVWNFTSTLPAE